MGAFCACQFAGGARGRDSCYQPSVVVSSLRCHRWQLLLLTTELKVTTGPTYIWAAINRYRPRKRTYKAIREQLVSVIPHLSFIGAGSEAPIYLSTFNLPCAQTSLRTYPLRGYVKCEFALLSQLCFVFLIFLRLYAHRAPRLCVFPHARARVCVCVCVSVCVCARAQVSGRLQRPCYSPLNQAMSIYKFSKNGRLFVQGTRQQSDRDNISANLDLSSSVSDTGMDLQAIHIKRKLSTEVLGSSSTCSASLRNRRGGVLYALNSD